MFQIICKNRFNQNFLHKNHIETIADLDEQHGVRWTATCIQRKTQKTVKRHRVA